MDKRFFRRCARNAAFSLLGCLLLAAPAFAAQEITVSGAASLTNAFTEIKGLFEKKYPDIKVLSNFAASNPLLKQMEEGAPEVKRIAVGNPDSVPAGRYTKAALTAAGLWETLQPKYVFGASVRQALDYVGRGEVDAGFVYRTDARQGGDKMKVAAVMDGHKPVLYPIAVATTGSNRDGGAKFVDFVLSPEGQAVLAKYGFSKPQK